MRFTIKIIAVAIFFLIAVAFAPSIGHIISERYEVGDDVDIYDSGNVVIDDSKVDNRFDENEDDDDVDMFIRNSNGNYWSATGSNLQSALDDLTDGGTVWTPGDTIINCSSQLKINYDNIILKGCGDSSVIRVADGSNLHVLQIGVVGSNTNNVIIENLQLDGNKEDVTVTDSRCGILCADASNVTIRTCWIHNYAYSGVWTNENSENILVENCRIEDARINPGEYGGGIKFKSNNSKAINNVIKNTWACGIIFENSASNPASHGIADGNIITGNNNTNGDYAGTAHGIHCEQSGYSNNITIVNNYIFNLNSTAYFASGNHWSIGILLSDNSICSNNIIKDIELRGISVISASNVTIDSNIIRNSSKGIYLDDVDYTIVTKNNIADCITNIDKTAAVINALIKDNIGYD